MSDPHCQTSGSASQLLTICFTGCRSAQSFEMFQTFLSSSSSGKTEASTPLVDLKSFGSAQKSLTVPGGPGQKRFSPEAKPRAFRRAISSAFVADSGYCQTSMLMSKRHGGAIGRRSRTQCRARSPQPILTRGIAWRDPEAVDSAFGG